MNKTTPLLLATSNEGKLRELRQILADLPFTFVGLADIPNIEPVPETGTTFIDNAVLKATGYASQARLLTMADDSGLEIDALDGAPGVYSARYLDESASFAERIDHVLTTLNKTEERARTARFVSAIVIARAGGNILNVSLGTCEGRIGFSPRGSGGFGYDPIFVPEGFDLTFGELSSEIKNQISHRAQSLRNARVFLRSLTDHSPAG